VAGVEARRRENWGALTASERTVADWLLEHLEHVPFETGASIAAELGVSPMTVGRCIRKLGYDDLKEIKAELRAATAELRGPVEPSSRTTFAPTTLKERTAGLERVYALERTKPWRRIVRALAHSPRVRVASFEIGRSMGIGFSASLQNLRPGVAFLDGSDAYADVLLDPDGALLTLIDLRRYSPSFRLLAEEAAARKIPTVILTDAGCHWARDYTSDMPMIETEFGIGSLTMAQLLFELLLAAVAVELGGAVARLEAAHALRVKFSPLPRFPGEET
jgi:DNA-binding MurR/RpiR family transcriptional regulator